MSDTTVHDGPEAAAPLVARLGPQGLAIIEEAMHDAGVGAAMLNPRDAVVWVHSSRGQGRTTLIDRFVTTLGDGHNTIRDRERKELLDLARRVGQPVQINGMAEGRWTRTIYRPLRDAHNGEMWILVTCRPICEYCPGQVHLSEAVTFRSRTDDLGELSALTERELQILRLIGKGLSTRQMASQLHRSEKTIEAHRLRLGQKLKGQTRVELARTAIRSGITLLSEQEVELIHRQRQSPPERSEKVQGDHQEE